MQLKPRRIKILTFHFIIAIGLLLPLDTIAQDEEPTLLEQATVGSEPEMHNWAIGLKLGTMGVGLDISRRINNSLGIRVGGSFLRTKIDQFSDSFKAFLTREVQLAGGNLFLDYYPGKNLEKRKFHLTFGAIYNASRINITGDPDNDEYLIGDYQVTRGEIGSIFLEANPGLKINPYLGIGIGQLPSVKRLSYNLDLGVMYAGKPSISLDASGMVTPTGEQDAQVEENMKWLRIIPYITLQLAYNF